MTKVTAVVVGLVIVLAVMAGLYAFGPKYVLKSHPRPCRSSALTAGWRTSFGSQLLSASAEISATALTHSASSSSAARQLGSESTTRSSARRTREERGTDERRD